MSIVINKNTVGVWFVAFDKQDADILFSIYKEDGKFKLKGRTRYYDENDPGNDPFSDKDSKNWFSRESSVEATIETEIIKARDAVKQFRDIMGSGQDWEFLMDEKGPEDLQKRFFAAPFVHKKEMPLYG